MRKSFEACLGSHSKTVPHKGRQGAADKAQQERRGAHHKRNDLSLNSGTQLVEGENRPSQLSSDLWLCVL